MSDLSQTATDIRKSILTMLHAAGSGHTAGPLGITDILTYLYFREMNIDPASPANPDRDRFVLSPAHMVPALYATLAHRGFFPIDELKTLRKAESRLKGHTYRNLEIGVETTGGSLAQGLGVAIGFAIAHNPSVLRTSPLNLRGERADKIGSRGDIRTYCLISDGELNEGSTWEAFQFAAKMKLSNLCIILDHNGIQLSNDTDTIMPMDSIRAKLEAFNLAVLEIDGHDYDQIAYAFAKAKQMTNKAVVILANTVAGKGVSFMQHNAAWHGKAPDDAELEHALTELDSCMVRCIIRHEYN